jgi:hypothetical protein
MFKIYDGRSQFYQWDLDRRLIVEDAEITQVHFCNRTGDCSLVCETYKEDGRTLVNVPNVLLQTDWRINVYAYDRNYTKFSESFDVVRRSKPESYVYTETETLNYNTLLDKMTDIEENVAEVVNDYLEEHPVEVDLTGYATEDYVDTAINEIELTPGPAGKPGKDGYTPVKGVDYFDGKPGKDGEDYVLTEEDKAEIAGMVEVTGGGDVDLSDYYTKSETDDAIQAAVDAIEIPEGGGGDHPVKAGTGDSSVMTLEASSASGSGSLALGSYSNATSDYSVAIGPGTRASSDYATTIGAYTQATQRYQCVTGCYNANDSKALFIVGVGSGTDVNERKNGLTIDVNQVAHFPGSVVVGADKAEVATKAYVDEAVANAGGSGEGGSVSVDGTTIVQNEDGTISATTPIKAGTGHCSIVSKGAISGKGDYTIAIGGSAITGDNHESIAIGHSVSAIRQGAVAIGIGLQTYRPQQMVIGRSNATNYPNARFIIGSGDGLVGERNAMVVEDDNNVLFPGTVLVQNGDKLSDFKEVATKAYVDEVSVNADGTTIVQNEDGTISATTPIKAGSANGSALLPGGYGAGSAAGKYSFSTGGGSARGDNSVALAGNANNDYSIAIGSGTKANKAFQVAIGYHNEVDNTANVVIGNGYVTPDYTYVSQNAMACYSEENTVHFPGKVVLGENKEEVATKAYVDANAGGGGANLSDYYTKSEVDAFFNPVTVLYEGDITRGQQVTLTDEESALLLATQDSTVTVTFNDKSVECYVHEMDGLEGTGYLVFDGVDVIMAFASLEFDGTSNTLLCGVSSDGHLKITKPVEKDYYAKNETDDAIQSAMDDAIQAAIDDTKAYVEELLGVIENGTY